MKKFIQETLKKEIGENEFSDILKIMNDESSKSILLDEFLYFVENEEKYYREAGEYVTFYPIHLIFILAELDVNITEPLMKLLKGFDSHRLEFWFADIITQELWYVFYKLSKNGFDEIVKYVFDRKIENVVIGSIFQGLYRLEMEGKERHADIVNIIKEIILNDKEDVEIQGMAINLALEINAKEIKKEVISVTKKINGKQYHVSSNHLEFGTDEEKSFYSSNFEKIYEGFKAYSYNKEWENNNTEEGKGGVYFNEIMRDFFGMNKSEQMISHKVGRNEPCPCGSGKKYKKCCGK